MTRYRQERGQAMVLTLICVTVVVIGLAAAVIDVGAWYNAHRQAQATADAAALAGVTELPENIATARSTAVDYGNRNGGGVTSGDVTFSNTVVGNDTIEVTSRKPVPGMFARLFGLGPVTARAHAKALSGVPGEARWAAPIGVDIKHPLLQCEPLPCFNQQTELDLKKTGPGAFRLINIDGSGGGTGPATLADWMRNGFDGSMPLEWYFSDPGAKFDSSHMKGALADRVGSELLFPVYRGTRAQGSNFEYEVVGWVGFHMTGFEAKGNGGKVDGWFTRIIWEGIQNEQATDDDFGARTVSLID